MPLVSPSKSRPWEDWYACSSTYRAANTLCHSSSLRGLPPNLVVLQHTHTHTYTHTHTQLYTHTHTHQALPLVLEGLLLCLPLPNYLQKGSLPSLPLCQVAQGVHCPKQLCCPQLARLLGLRTVATAVGLFRSTGSLEPSNRQHRHC